MEVGDRVDSHSNLFVHFVGQASRNNKGKGSAFRVVEGDGIQGHIVLFSQKRDGLNIGWKT